MVLDSAWTNMALFNFFKTSTQVIKLRSKPGMTLEKPWGGSRLNLEIMKREEQFPLQSLVSFFEVPCPPRAAFCIDQWAVVGGEGRKVLFC